jgi:hypothetical protein
MKLFALLCFLAGCASAPQAVPELRDIRQLTTDGTHAEAYFSYDGKKLVLMAQRAGDKADQIYELEVATKTLTRVSNGEGRTTCGYFLPDTMPSLLPRPTTRRAMCGASTVRTTSSFARRTER